MNCRLEKPGLEAVTPYKPPRTGVSHLQSPFSLPHCSLSGRLIKKKKKEKYIERENIEKGVVWVSMEVQLIGEEQLGQKAKDDLPVSGAGIYSSGCPGVLHGSPDIRNMHALQFLVTLPFS